MNFSSEFALGRQRCRTWVSLITQQLRLRHVYQICVYNLAEDKKALYYYTLHSTLMCSPIYTSEKVAGRHLKWNELTFLDTSEASSTSVVFRLWKSTKKGDEIMLTWGVNFSGLVCLGNKIADLQPKYFKVNSVIFIIQGVYFTSQHYIRHDLDKPLPFQKNLNLIQTLKEDPVVYRRVGVKVPKGEVASSYSLDKLRRLQELQRQIKNKRTEVEHVKEKIKSLSEREQKQEVYSSKDHHNSIRFAPQLLTMNSLNKMLHEKPTKAERELMTQIMKKMEVCRFRLRLLHEERDKKSINIRKLKQKLTELEDENEERNSNLMSLYHTLSKESHQWDEYRHRLMARRERLLMLNDQLKMRQADLLKELLFIYPISKIPKENKYTMLGIHLPDSETLIDYQDAGVSVVLGYICHILMMCSIFLQVPLRHPVKHYGSRSVIYNQVYPDVPDKDREFPLYIKGRDRAHFNLAVFLLNKNISQLRWYLHRKITVDLKETLKHVRSLLLGDDVPDPRQHYSHHLHSSDKRLSTRPSTLTGDVSMAGDDPVSSLDKLVSPSLSTISSTNLHDPLLDRIHQELKEEMRHNSRSSRASTPSPVKKKTGIFRSNSKPRKNDKESKESGEALAVPEAYLNRQISKDVFHRCASEGHKLIRNVEVFEQKEIKIGEGVEDLASSKEYNHSDSIEEGTDPLDPSVNLDALITKSIDIKQPKPITETRISRSVDTSYTHDSYFQKANQLEKDVASVGTITKLAVSSSPKEGSLQHWLSGHCSDITFPEECLHMSLQDISNPLTERTDRLLSTNQSFNFVKHRPAE
ncbi:UV radiation resistance-associated gene protein [Anthonomus grandis grandis]|uniref:UV radiation resistance-associated gene protein n=1 Tax=Anthonomus grandis grandis TaxID=2921223 RepID=UPI002166AA9B|nr:UV radiation resistance-associated gene protein [Anthonomus grandis grandis]